MEKKPYYKQQRAQLQGGDKSDNFLLSLVVGRRELEGSLNGYQVKGKCAVGSTP